MEQLFQRKRGFSGIGIENVKDRFNIGTLFLSAHCFGADFIFTIGERYKKQASDTTKAWKSIPLLHFKDFNDFYGHIPLDCCLVGIEITETARSLNNFIHPERAVYILGAEDYGLSTVAIEKCKQIVKITQSSLCLNVSVAGSIIMFDRLSKINNGK